MIDTSQATRTVLDAASGVFRELRGFLSFWIIFKIGVLLLCVSFITEISTSHFYFQRIDTKLQLLEKVERLTTHDSLAIQNIVDQELLEVASELSLFETNNPNIYHLIPDFKKISSIIDTTLLMFNGNQSERASERQLQLLETQIRRQKELTVLYEQEERRRLAEAERKSQEAIAWEEYKPTFRRNKFLTGSIVPFLAIMIALLYSTIRGIVDFRLDRWALAKNFTLAILYACSVGIVCGFFALLIPRLVIEGVNYIGIPLVEIYFISFLMLKDEDLRDWFPGFI